ncbi:MAG: biotin--[acetyl-CoA-carboxylase] ligase [Thermoguttaceae bacterium]
MSLDINRILRETFIVEVEQHETITSTNDRAAERAKQGAKNLPMLVIAESQTAGRGRGANRWWTGAGSLAFSLLLAPSDRDTEKTSLISLAAGLSVAEAVKPLLPNQAVGIHWPNDVIVGERKLAGILVEVLPQRHVIIGIGINTNNSLADAPHELRETATTIMELTGNRCDHTALMVALLGNMQRHLVTLLRSPEELAAAANEMCLQRGKLLTIISGGQTDTGLCQGISSDGALLLKTNAGVRSFYSGIAAISKKQ